MSQDTKVTNEAVAKERKKQEEAQMKEKQQGIRLYCPVKGEVLPITKAPDQAFAEMLLGQGVVIMPQDHTVYSPCDGEIFFLFPTKHTIIIKEDSGLEVLIHIGKDTIHLEKDIFTLCVTEGQQVKKGDKLIEFDLPYLKKYAKSSAIPMVVSDLQGKQMTMIKTGLSNEKELIIEIR